MSRVLLEQLLDHDASALAAHTRGLLMPAARAKSALWAQAAARLAQAGLAAQTPVDAFFVPGRVEVLGKHTDYAGGRSLVAAMEQGFCLVAAPRADAVIQVHASQGESACFSLDPDISPAHGHWSNYPMTVARRLARNFSACRRGMDLAFASDLPPAAGMSSSSAFMVGTYLALAAGNELEHDPLFLRHLCDPLALASYLGTVENGQSFGVLAGDRGVGTFGGSEDHTAILCSRPDHLGQFAYCPSRTERYVPFPADQLLAIGCSGVVAEKARAAQEFYNRVSARVGAIVEIWRQATGSGETYLADVLAQGADATARLQQLVAQHAGGTFSAAELSARLTHFVAENEEIAAPAGTALARGDLAVFGRLVDRSQALASALLGNQIPETIALARLAREHGATAASAFGAGFGGSVWALVAKERAPAFLSQWSQAYVAAFPQAAAKASFFSTNAGPAAFALY